MNKSDKEITVGVVIILGLLFLVAVVDVPFWVWLGLMGVAVVTFMAVVRDLYAKFRKLYGK